MSTNTHRTGFIGLGAAVLALGAVAAVWGQPSNPEPAKPAAAAPREFSIEGSYVEACTCRMPCPCELTGAMDGCKGVGAYQINKGVYGGTDFSGVKLAYVLTLGEAVVVYVDAADPKKEEAATTFARAAFAAFGPIKAVKKARIEISGNEGAYTVAVDGGKALRFETEPVLGGDKKTAIVHSNTNSTLNPIMYQGSCVSCTVNDEGISFTVSKGRNAYFNHRLKTVGKV